jgi:hypothetical protein
VNDQLLRPSSRRRIDRVEVTARADAPDESATMRVEALVRDVSDRKLEDQGRDLPQLLQAAVLAALGQTIRASPMS